jgi:hypothetical protein
MLDLDSLELRDELTLSREVSTPGERADLFNRVRRGEQVRLRRGVYVSAAAWARLDPAARNRWESQATVALSGRDIVISHHSAAALWRMPWFGQLPTATHTVDDFAKGGRSSFELIRHTVGIPEITERIDGVRVTTLARTVVDLCRISTFQQSVVIADAALHRTAHPLPHFPRTLLTSEHLAAELSLVHLRQGRTKARRAIDFADGSADRPGESLSRVNIALAGLSAPRLQVPLRGASGKRWFVDFWWPQFNLIGEFDGNMKYTDPEFLRGRTPQRALIDEKRREDDLRAAGHGMSRWPWETAMSIPRLRQHLLLAGVR